MILGLEIIVMLFVTLSLLNARTGPVRCTRVENGRVVTVVGDDQMIMERMVADRHASAGLEIATCSS